MKFTGIAISALACALTVGTGVAAAQYGAGVQPIVWNGHQPQYQNRYGDGDADDGYGARGYGREYQRFEQQGYREGYRGAFKDFENHRSATPMNRDEYRDPDDVPRQAVRVYRIAFRQGYLRGVEDLRAYPTSEGR